MCIGYCEDGVSSGICQKDVTDKTSFRPGTHGPGIRRHTVSSDVNTSAVGIICTCLFFLVYLLHICGVRHLHNLF